jgi:serine O-acetyltransferase
MIDEFLADCSRYNDNQKTTFWQALKLTYRNQGLVALLGYRLGQAARSSNKTLAAWPLLPLYWLGHILYTGYVRAAYDIRLSSSADIGAGLYIGHFGGIAVGDCKIGRNCNIGQSTRVGSEGAGGPIVGDYVWLGPHAQVIGPYRIGSGSTISAGAIVKRDIPEAALGMGNPARVVMMNYDNSAILGLPETTVKKALQLAAETANGTQL